MVEELLGKSGSGSLIGLSGPQLLSGGGGGGGGDFFFDDFHGTVLRPEWLVYNHAGDQSNSELQYYRPGNVVVNNGLTLTAKVESFGGFAYTSGGIMWQSLSFQYGTVTVRAKMPGGLGPWPAIWMLGAVGCQAAQPTFSGCTPAWPTAMTSDEVDLAEFLGSNFTTVNEQIHSGSHNDGCRPVISDASVNWHDYKTVWTATSLDFFVDGVLQCTVTQPISGSKFLILNVAVGGQGGAVTDGTLPQSMQVAYVRVTQP